MREQILSGQFSTGQLLPNERELVEQSGLSRGSVREAMLILETQGLISTTVGRNQGRRAIVPGNNVVRESINIFVRGRQIPFRSLMETLEAFAPTVCALAAANRSEKDLMALDECRERLKITLGAKKFVKANFEWHAALGRASHNPLLGAIYESLGPNMVDPHVAGFTSKDVRTATRFAVDRIHESIAQKDTEAAQRRMLSHVQAYRRMIEPIAPRTVSL
ncbi:MAG: FadR/GntR family transcriptional regulator [Syntrophotalea sp.]|uniref:FadR/GntR family transcriptional regulator n=1 Tax=Syntrophotalea sp. TaxID=2812029 RepID=UPI003D0D502A